MGWGSLAWAWVSLGVSLASFGFGVWKGVEAILKGKSKVNLVTLLFVLIWCILSSVIVGIILGIIYFIIYLISLF